MRDDMAKVIVERPRVGRGYSLKRRKAAQRALREPYDAPHREPMSMGRGTKWLNENLAPLKRYLHRQVGRPWDCVYADISQHLRPSNAVQQHVRDHLEDFVLIHVSLKSDGNLIVGSRWGQGPLEELNWGPSLYVCPRTGLLRRRRQQVSHAKQRREKKRQEALRVHAERRWDGERMLRCIEGLWYALEFAPVPATREACMGARDIFLKCPVRDLFQKRERLTDTYDRADVYAVRKRQLGKRELREFECRNVESKKVERKRPSNRRRRNRR